MNTKMIELMATIGTGLIVYGLWLIYPPLAWIVTGLSLVSASVRVHPRRKAPRMAE